MANDMIFNQKKLKCSVYQNSDESEIACSCKMINARKNEPSLSVTCVILPMAALVAALSKGLHCKSLRMLLLLPAFVIRQQIV